MSLILDVLYEDAALIAVEKLPGELVIPGRGALAAKPTLQQAVSAKLGRKALVCHRLDAEAGGLVLFAKTPRAHAAVNAAFESRAARKTYLAAVLGDVPAQGRVDSPLREFGSGRTGVSPEGKPCLTLYKPLAAEAGKTLLEVGLVTGRRHQIRAHLSSIGRPILGDPLYGPPPRPVGGAARLMLHAWKLEIPGLLPLVVCPPPGGFYLKERLA